MSYWVWGGGCWCLLLSLYSRNSRVPFEDPVFKLEGVLVGPLPAPADRSECLLCLQT